MYHLIHFNALKHTKFHVYILYGTVTMLLATTGDKGHAEADERNPTSDNRQIIGPKQVAIPQLERVSLFAANVSDFLRTPTVGENGAADAD